MENSTRLVQGNNKSLNFPSSSSSSSPLNSPHSNGTNNNSNSNGVVQIHTPPLTPIPISRSETNPYPTTFVQADTTTFKQVVQMLTGSSETPKQASSKPPTQQHQHHHHHQDQGIPPSRSSFPLPPMKTNSPKKQNFKLYERRNSNLKNNLMMINTFQPSSVANNGGGGGAYYSPRNAEILSPSLLDFPKLALSPVTPLNEDTFNKSSPSLGNSYEEDKAIAEKGFYLHPSPMSTPRDTEPQLLPLFPVTSPRVSGSS
ncbi:VQ motif-containing protein 33 [Hibiscus syriacus]|uniref:VQ motif-containing protein 33 n=1 Tax=Hibiscus syriacus TaxID=106335 RepID=A0A6A3B8B2_HIBSY|nr:VQ motif-containing protein 19-like [Hibiscus syriacus]KAE8713056.1 VQ motif-containing protein 33 [Hibiscus syriacus]